MSIEAMNEFLSRENVERHVEYLRTLRLRYSIIEKSVPVISKMEPPVLLRSGIDREIKDEAVRLLVSIKSHELFFRSFASIPILDRYEIKGYSSIDAFLFDILLMAREKPSGFIFLYTDRGIPRARFSCLDDRAFIDYEPILAIDIFEHAYFNDYGFDRERYLRAALSHLDLTKLGSEGKIS